MKQKHQYQIILIGRELKPKFRECSPLKGSLKGKNRKKSSFLRFLLNILMILRECKGSGVDLFIKDIKQKIPIFISKLSKVTNFNIVEIGEKQKLSTANLRNDY